MLLSGIRIIFVVGRVVLIVRGGVSWVVRVQMMFFVVGHDGVLALAAESAAYLLVIWEDFEHILVFLICKAVAMAVMRWVMMRL